MILGVTFSFCESRGVDSLSDTGDSCCMLEVGCLVQWSLDAVAFAVHAVVRNGRLEERDVLGNLGSGSSIAWTLSHEFHHPQHDLEPSQDIPGTLMHEVDGRK